MNNNANELGQSLELNNHHSFQKSTQIKSEVKLKLTENQSILTTSYFHFCTSRRVNNVAQNATKIIMILTQEVKAEKMFDFQMRQKQFEG